MTMHLGEAMISPGMTGETVKWIQQVLNGQGYNAGPIDGIFGPNTQSAVQAFQKAKGLIPDGIVGPLTWNALQGSPATPEPLPAPAPKKEAPSGLGGFSTMALYGLGALAAVVLFFGKRR